MPDGRVKIDVQDGEIVLTCKAAEKGDNGTKPVHAESTRALAGKYTCTLKNPLGSDSIPVSVTVLDAPAAPLGPLEVGGITPDSCVLKWEPPKVRLQLQRQLQGQLQDDGGSPVSNYVVEKRSRKSGKWEPVSKFVRVPEYEVMGLEEGEQYEFRVSAVNDNGQSEPLEAAKPITAKHQFGEAPSPVPLLTGLRRRAGRALEAGCGPRGRGVGASQLGEAACGRRLEDHGVRGGGAREGQRHLHAAQREVSLQRHGFHR